MTIEIESPLMESTTVATARRFETYVVPPPSEVLPFVLRGREGPGDWVDYASHPAYRVPAQAASAPARVLSLLTFARYFSVIFIKRAISYELIPAHLRAIRSPAAALRFGAVALGRAFFKLLPLRRYGQAGASPIAQALARDGVCVLRVDDARLQDVAAASAPLIEALRSARGACGEGRRFEESRAAANRLTHAELFAAVERMLIDIQVIDGISHYLGRKASLVDINPQINDKSDDFWRRIFPDRQHETRPAAYFHRDASGGDVKAMIYLSDVGPSNGPFSFAVGSHRVRSSTLVGWIEETNDQSGFSGTAAQVRARFAALPSLLRRKCAVGNDILPDTDIARRLLAAEWSIAATQGHVVLFDTKGFHRGGMVIDGERLVLTCVVG